MKLFTIIEWIYKITTTIITILAGFVVTSISFGLPFDRDSILTKINSISDVTEGRIWCAAVGLFILILAFAYLYLKAKSAHQDATIAFDNPDGEVSISMRAIEDFVMRVGKEFAEIKDLQPKIKARKEGVDIHLKVELWSGMNLPKMTEALQNVVKSQVQNILGIENVHSVQVMVTKIIAREKDYDAPAAQGDMFQRQETIQQGSEDNY